MRQKGRQMPARQKTPDGAEPLIIQEGGEPTSSADKPTDKSGAALRNKDLRQMIRPIAQYCPILGNLSDYGELARPLACPQAEEP